MRAPFKTLPPLNRLLALKWRICPPTNIFTAAEHVIYLLDREQVLVKDPLSALKVLKTGYLF